MLPNTDPSKQPPLTSWKQIAEYLNVTVRTAQNWEQSRSLPVHRLPGKRGMVWAEVAELDAWRTGQTPEPQPAPREAPAWRPRLGVRRVVFLAAVLVLCATGVAWWLSGPRKPALFLCEQNVLVVSDAENHELWRYTLDFPPEKSSQYKDWISVQFDDVDDDGNIETLVSCGPCRTRTVHCLSQTGREKWQFQAGRSVSSRGESFSPMYTIKAIAVDRVTEHEPKVIFVLSSHDLYYPCQIALLSPSGKLIREYWHSGGLQAMQIFDLDGDGAKELYLAGINNAAKSATLVVLDPRSPGGAIPEDEHPDYQLLGFPRVTPRARVFFPRSCFNRKFMPWSNADRLEVRPGEISLEVVEGYFPESVITRAGNYFHLRSDLSLGKLVVGDSFRSAHAELEAKGEIDHRFSPQEEAELRKIRVVRER